jgi:16S rRNA (cytosine967-C5)-methyltransferase
MNRSSTTLRLPKTPARQRDRVSGISPTRRPPPPAPRAPKTLAPDSLAWAMQTAAACVTDVIAFGRSLTVVLSELRQRDLPAHAVRAQAIDLAYATLRRYRRADIELSVLLDRPTAEDELRNLLRVALCWLEMHPDRAHVGVDQAVEAAAMMSGGRYRGFVNAILRRALRERAHLDQTIAREAEATWQHPQWWLNRLQEDWPAQWQAIVAGGNRKPPMGLRVNPLATTPDTYAAQLAAAEIALQDRMPEDGPDALLLAQPRPAETLPGFAAGLVSIQDIGAQQAARLLNVQPGMRVLDACAAPGGKAVHLLQSAAISLIAVEADRERCAALTRALDPARFPADRAVQVICADATETLASWAKRPFDAILLDAPCSGSGVAGRHPDAKWLRRDEDIYALARTQKRLLKAMWPLLKPGGRLLYGTCSVFAQENQQQIARFLEQHPDARLVSQQHLLPDARHDGFFYALLSKDAK